MASSGHVPPGGDESAREEDAAPRLRRAMHETGRCSGSAPENRVKELWTAALGRCRVAAALRVELWAIPSAHVADDDALGGHGQRPENDFWLQKVVFQLCYTDDIVNPFRLRPRSSALLFYSVPWA